MKYLIIILLFISCQIDEVDVYRTDYKPYPPLEMSIDDINIGKLINHYRTKDVKPDALLFELAKGHANYVASKEIANHDNFPNRVYIIRQNNGVSTMEGVAYGYYDVNRFFNAYITNIDSKNNYTHRKIITGDFTHYGHHLINNYDVLILTRYE